MEERYQLFTTLISRCSRSVKRIKSNEMSKLNLKSSYSSCLYNLYVNEKPITATELCELCDEDKSYISKTVDLLEKEGYVVCSSKTLKKYNCPISLTEKGKMVAKGVADTIEMVVDEASKGLSQENRKIFYESLTLIANNLETYVGK